MSAINIPGLDITERCGSFRVRARVHPFYDLTATHSCALDAALWGCTELVRLHQLKAGLKDAGRLPAVAVTREDAGQLGLCDLIDGAEASPEIKARSPGAAISVRKVMDSYMSIEAKDFSAGYFSRAKTLSEFFGGKMLADVTSEVLDDFERKRLSGELGMGRSGPTAAYATKNREYQKNKRRKKRGIPVVCQMPTRNAPSSGSVRHELKLLRQALKAYAMRDDETREQLAAYVQLHPIMTRKLPAPGAPRTRRAGDEELKKVLKKIKCPRKRSAVLLALYTTLRRAEVMSLRAEDIRWDQKTVLLRARTEPDPERPGAVRPVRKSKTTERLVPLIPEALELLESIAPQGTSGRVFNFGEGSLTQAFGRAAEFAAVIDLRVHDLRRESVSWLHEVHKLTLVELTLFTGHGDVATLQKHYLKPDPARLAAQLADKVGGRDLAVQ